VLYLGCTHGGHVGAGAGEGRVEGASCTIGVLTACAAGESAAFVAVAGYAVVTGGVDDGDASETEFHILVALALCVEGCKIGFVVAVGGGNDLGRGIRAAILTLVASKGIGVYTIADRC
jgi:hypothetical protein